MSTALQIPQGATVLTLETPTLLQVVKTASSFITPYADALEKYEHLAQLQQWCNDSVQANSRLLNLEDYGWDTDELTEYNKIKKVYKGLFGSTINMGGSFGGTERFGFATRAVKSNSPFQQDIIAVKSELEIPEKNLMANIQYVNIIPERYRCPLALNEIYSYLSSFRAENWKEAVNLFEEQLHRWQMEANSEQALLLQAQTAVLAGKASSRAGAAVLFSGLNFFLK